MKLDIVYLDIETVPTDEAIEHEFGPKFDFNAATDEQKERIKWMSLSGATGKVICLSVARSDAAPVAITGSEADIIKAFWEGSRAANLFVGHNILDFDLRFLVQRSIVLGIRPSRDIPFIRFRQSPVYDTMHEWSKWGREHISLDNLCRALGVASSKTGGMDGSLVFPAYLEGRLPEIADYCREDVRAVRDCYKRMLFIPVAETGLSVQ